MNVPPRIYADFNKLDEDRSAILACRGTIEDLAALNLELNEGMRVVLYMPDDLDERGSLDFLEVDAVIEFNQALNCWVGAFVWDELEYRSKSGRRP